MAPLVFFTRQANGSARPPTRRETITIWCSALIWLWSMINTRVRPLAPARASTSRANGAIISSVSIESIAEQAADPLVAHVEPRGGARQGSGQLHQIDVAHGQGRGHQQSQPFARLLVLSRQSRGEVRPDRGRHGCNPTHPQASPSTAGPLQSQRGPAHQEI